MNQLERLAFVSDYELDDILAEEYFEIESKKTLDELLLEILEILEEE